jgi:exopolysaccharide biosynthesis WecB/TagA/CpsF family protein
MNKIIAFNKFKKNLDIKNTVKKKKVIFMNPHSYIQIFKDKSFFYAVKNCSDIYIDGVGLYILIKLNFFLSKKKIILNRITGYDYFNYIIKNIYKKNILLVGSTKKILQFMKRRILVENPSCRVYLLNAPFVKNEFTNRQVKNIFKNFKNKKIDYCFVSTGAPKQEKFAELISTEVAKKGINIRTIASVGTVFNYYTENLSFIFFLSRKIYLEWLYRLVKNIRLWNRTFISLPIFIFLNLISVKPDYLELQIFKSVKRIILLKKKFILCAFNLACYSYIYQKKIKINKNFYFWQDGIFTKYLYKKYKKLPGRKLISNLILPQNIKSILVIGNLSLAAKLFLEKKYNILVISKLLPFGNINKILKKVPKVHSSQLILITLPTPKQEIIANFISRKYKNSKIICIGGGLEIAAKVEKPCPKFLEKIYLEFLWRLQYQTIRRSMRLINTLYIFIKANLSFFNKRVNFNEI